MIDEQEKPAQEQTEQESKEEIKTPPKPITIIGMDKDLGAILDSFVGHWELVEVNKAAYMNKWKEFLPEEKYNEKEKKVEVTHRPWSMAYVPRISIRKTFAGSMTPGLPGIEKLSNWPYFIIVANSARDDRPQKPVPVGEDLLQKNILDKGMIIAEEVDDFFLTPNGFPYHKYASLLISKQKRPQKEVTPQDIATWIKFSFLTGQYIFFNSVGAGASRAERFHAQVVSQDALREEKKRILEYPIKNPNLIRKNKVKEGIYELKDYPIEALIFSGKDAHHQAARLVSRLEGLDISYNVIVDGTEVYVVGRNKKRERSDCIGKKVGGYECSGVVLVGNVEEPILGQAGLEKIVHLEDVFTALSYEVISSNLNAASMPTNWMKDLL